MKIDNAIHSRHILSFTYKGHHRIVEPHTYGVDQNGHMVLNAYQIGGSSSGTIPDFRNFVMADIIALSVSEKIFSGPRPGYKRNNSFYSTIHAQL